MKSVFKASLIACVLALAAGCSSAGSSSSDTGLAPASTATDDGDTSPLSQSLEAPERAPVNPCAAVLCPAPSRCDVVDGQAVCSPIEPAPSGPFCGGFAGIECPGAGTCQDDPGDDCDPARGGADCGGLCECQSLALCIQGTIFDPSPEVCACVPQEPEPDACAAVRCRSGTHCEAFDDRARCVRDAATNPCAAVLCAAPSSCEVVEGEAVCVPIEIGPFCGGIAAFQCPGSGSCVDDPRDGCDPARGGADCSGVCECQIRALCIQGFVFDESPEVCSCVPVGDECRADAG